MARRLCCSLALLLAFCLWLLAGAARAAPSPFRVLDYDSRVELQKDGDIIVTESITIEVPTSGTNRGIIRDIPVNPRWEEMGRQNVELKVLKVTIDGKPCPTDDIASNYPVLSIYMRDKGSYLSAGVHVLELRFRMSEQIGFFDEGDELTWNAVGEFWDGGVQQASATILAPVGASFTQHQAWLGRRGSKDSPVSMRVQQSKTGREAIIFEAQRPIREGEAFTIAVQLPKGIIAEPEVVNPADQWSYTLFYAACLAASAFGAYKLWERHGKDPEAGAVIPLFYPPKVPQRLRTTKEDGTPRKRRYNDFPLHGEEYLTPAAVHYVHEGGKLEASGLAALFLSLAQRGDCTLHGNARTGITVEKHANSSPAPEEQAAAEKIPAKLKLNARKSTNSPIGRVYSQCRLLLDMDYPMVVDWNYLPQLGLLLAMVITIVVAAFCQLGGSLTPYTMNALGETCGGALLLFGSLGGVAATIYNTVKNKELSLDLLVTLGICGFIGYVGYTILADSEFLGIFSPLQWGLMIAALLPPLGFLFLMDMPSREQVELKRDVEGLALYIGTAETARFNMLNPPEEDLQLYHRLLPYAVALGLEDAWGKRFADKLAAALQAGELMQEEIYDSDFTGSLVRSSRLSLSTYREAVFAEQAAKYASSSGGGSSFGGFGGGAGSGGGGGGGRAC